MKYVTGAIPRQTICEGDRRQIWEAAAQDSHALPALEIQVAFKTLWDLLELYGIHRQFNSDPNMLFTKNLA